MNIFVKADQNMLRLYRSDMKESVGYLQEMTDGTWSASLPMGGLGGGLGFNAKTQKQVINKVQKYFNDL